MLFILELIPPTIKITSNGPPTIKEAYSITCTVSTLDLLIPHIKLQWTQQSSKESPISPLMTLNGEQTSTLMMTSLSTSDAGLYTCTATVSLADLELTVMNSTDHTLELKSE